MKAQGLLISTALVIGGCSSSRAPEAAASTRDAIPTSTTFVDDGQANPLPSVEAFTSCAIVEAGYLAALGGDSGAAGLYARGATAAIDSGSPDYTPLGKNLEHALSGLNVNQTANKLLVQCQIDGFERLEE